MYHTDFARSIAQQHTADLVRDAQAYAARKNQRKADKAYRRSFTWSAVQNWQLAH